jgi:hypothetical protein
MGYTSQGSLSQFGDPEALLAAARRTVERVGDDLLNRTVEHTPVAKPPPGHESEWLEARNREPGTLRESWKCGEVTVDEGGTTFTVDVYTNDRIAPYVEWPTRPHLIGASPGKMLRFWDSVGNTVYARLVHHPGTAGSYMLTTALAEVAANWQAIGAEEMQQWAREQTAAIG